MIPTQQLLVDVRQNFIPRQSNFDQAELNFICHKETPKDRIRGILTRGFRHRETLARTGLLIWGYTFKYYLPAANRDKAYLTWIVFSPEVSAENDPTFLEKVVHNLDEFAQTRPNDWKNNAIYNAMRAEVSEPQYLLVPSQLSEGHLVYLHFLEVDPDQIYDFKLGYNLILILPATTKEVLYLPRRYWSPSYREAYENTI